MNGKPEAAHLLVQHPPLVDLSEAGQDESDQLLADLTLRLDVPALLAQILGQEG